MTVKKQPKPTAKLTEREIYLKFLKENASKGGQANIRKHGTKRMSEIVTNRWKKEKEAKDSNA